MSGKASPMQQGAHPILYRPAEAVSATNGIYRPERPGSPINALGGGMRSPKPGKMPAQPKAGTFQVKSAVLEEEEAPIPEQPALFLPAASPALLIEKSDYHDFLAELGTRYSFPERRPTCVVVISSRWVSETDNVQVMANPRPRTVHDFFGFAEGLYEVEYCARCEAEHSAKVAEVLAVAGIPVEFEGQRGFDVGCWSPLCLIFPAADVPVVQVSLHGSRDAQFHVRIGKALGALRDIGYLIVGTGGVTWNLLDLDYGGGEPPAAAVAVDRWVKDVVSREENKPQWLAAADADVAWEARSQKLARIFDHRVDIAEAARRAHPSPDSFLPLIVASGPQPPSTLLKNVSSAAAADPLLIETEPVVHRKFG